MTFWNNCWKKGWFAICSRLSSLQWLLCHQYWIFKSHSCVKDMRHVNNITGWKIKLETVSVLPWGGSILSIRGKIGSTCCTRGFISQCVCWFNSAAFKAYPAEEGPLTGMTLLTVVLYTQERVVYSVRHPSNSCSDSDTFSWKSSADLFAIPK